MSWIIKQASASVYWWC